MYVLFFIFLITKRLVFICFFIIQLLLFIVVNLFLNVVLNNQIITRRRRAHNILHTSMFVAVIFEDVNMRIILVLNIIGKSLFVLSIIPLLERYFRVNIYRSLERLVALQQVIINICNFVLLLRQTPTVSIIV